MQIGAYFPQLIQSRSEVLVAADALEAFGFEHVLVHDHVLGAERTGRPERDGPYSKDDPFHEPLVLLALIAGRTDLGIATGVLVLPQRQTVLVAKQAAELDRLSAGNLRLGVGIGWNQVEFEALGQRFADRADRLEAQVALLRRLWTEPVVEVEGDEPVRAAGLVPLPVQRPVPIWLGTGGDSRAVDRVGRIADGWVPQLAPGPMFDEAWRQVQRVAAASGREPGTIGLEGSVQISSPLDQDRLRRAADRWRSLGATHLSVNVGRASDDLSENLELLGSAAAVITR